MKKTLINVCLSLCFVLWCTAVSAQFKAIGYLPYYQFNRIDQIELSKLTHLNIAFANPDMDGNLSVGGRDIQPIVDAAHAVSLEVFLSLAGGALTSEWEQAWEHLLLPQNKSAFIHKIINYCLDYDLQGIDVDLEWSHVDEYYSPFVLELRDSATYHGLTLTAALPGTYRFPDISAAALAAFDWINMMVYDLRGPWNPSDAGPHSPVSFAYSSINYWDGQGVETDRLTLGVPFYGYDFSNPSNVHALTYRAIVNSNSQNAYRDQVGDIFYNGIPTIEEKTEIALDQLSGIMIWELGQDHYSEYSLLKHISDKIVEVVSVAESIRAETIDIYPNPVTSTLIVEHTNNVDIASVDLHDTNGRQVMATKRPNGSIIELDLSSISAGVYLLKVTSDHEVHMKRIIKR